MRGDNIMGGNCYDCGRELIKSEHPEGRSRCNVCENTYEINILKEQIEELLSR
jgi:hypothetical protein